MPTIVQTNFFPSPDEPKIYLVYLYSEKHIPWEACMKILMRIFNRSHEEALAITDEIQTNGEGLCGAYLYDIAETKAETVERYAKKANLSLECLLEDV